MSAGESARPAAFPIGRPVLRTADAAAGMTPGSHGSTLRRQSAGGRRGECGARTSCSSPGFFEHAQKMSLLLKQKLASVVDRHPSVVAEVRGEGLLVGVKAVVSLCRPGHRRCARQKLLTVGAGDNVVRFLPPLDRH